ncbi:hypothetical protein C451_02168 [Halococcus thailandensis JCM 13552]|uniref:Uncharacterized protein n=1 Tax=Halococcus thailandensis JCM 13552 TaxID=1227457 RepID=M0NEV5_9EURY|nr:hypothetical protein C451_02168 [Halococcus thailandensis JCM 13552]
MVFIMMETHDFSIDRRFQRVVIVRQWWKFIARDTTLIGDGIRVALAISIVTFVVGRHNTCTADRSSSCETQHLKCCSTRRLLKGLS